MYDFSDDKEENNVQTPQPTNDFEQELQKYLNMPMSLKQQQRIRFYFWQKTNQYFLF